MNTTNTISRRSLLAAAPAAAIAVAIPMKASASDFAGWEQAKADYRAAEVATNAAIDHQAAAERVVFRFADEAPTARITHTVDAWSNGTVMLAAHEQTYPLTQRNYKSAIFDGWKHLPEYQAYAQRVAEWENTPEHVTAREASARAYQATNRALDAQMVAWEALVAFPLHDAASIADKLATAFPWVDEDPDMTKTLFDAVADDLARAAA